MTKFTYDDRVKVKQEAPVEFRPGHHAWVIGVLEKRPSKLINYSEGQLYAIEFEDGTAVDIPENLLEGA